jgi:hypothetical protein
MIRNLFEGPTPLSHASLYLAATTQDFGGQSNSIYGNYMMGWFCVFLSFLVTVRKCFPKAHPLRSSFPIWYTGGQEMVEFTMMRIIMTNYFFIHHRLNTNYLATYVAFYHVGGLVGSVFYGCIYPKLGAKLTVIIHVILSGVTYIVMSMVVGGQMNRTLTMNDRDYFMNGGGGSKKVRALVDQVLAKNLGAAFGFEGGLPNTYNYCILLTLFMGFTNNASAATTTPLLEQWSLSESAGRRAMLMKCFVYWSCAPAIGICLGELLYILLDIHGTFLFMAIYKLVTCLIACLDYADSDNMRVDGPTGNPCYMKGFYYASYLWPQGNAHVSDMLIFMMHSRWKQSSPLLGHNLGHKPYHGMASSCCFFEFNCTQLHIPTIGGLLLAIGAAPNPLWSSLYMEWFNLYDTTCGFYVIYLWVSMWPAFAAIYMSYPALAFLIGVNEGLRNLGHFFGIGRWPNQLFCGDPMACWRSQYLYSHAVFYNSGGDHGNVNYVMWYLFSKAQKRQCCCPYRKLKPDAPERCCPPCCLGPLVEETGGCPCPCCCSSCSS